MLCLKTFNIYDTFKVANGLILYWVSPLGITDISSGLRMSSCQKVEADFLFAMLLRTSKRKLFCFYSHEAFMMKDSNVYNIFRKIDDYKPNLSPNSSCYTRNFSQDFARNARTLNELENISKKI